MRSDLRTDAELAEMTRSGRMVETPAATPAETLNGRWMNAYGEMLRSERRLAAEVVACRRVLRERLAGPRYFIGIGGLFCSWCGTLFYLVTESGEVPDMEGHRCTFEDEARACLPESQDG